PGVTAPRRRRPIRPSRGRWRVASRCHGWRPSPLPRVSSTWLRADHRRTATVKHLRTARHGTGTGAVRGMIVVINSIPVGKGHEIDFEDRFRKRVHLVDRSPGFIRNEVHRPRPMRFDHEHGTWTDDPAGEGYYEVKTWWRSFDDFVAWTTSPAFAEAHSSRPPKEMFSGPNVLEVHEILNSTDLPVG